MTSIPRLLIGSGILLIVIGLLWHLSSRSQIPLGRLPGDIVIERGTFRFYFPLVTSVLISLILTLLLRLFK